MKRKKKVIKKIINKVKRRKAVEINGQVLSVNGVEYVPKNSQVQKEFEGATKIVILQRGWVMVGKFERSGNDCKLHNAAVIRSWGTTKGLGELAANGPIKDKTILDKCFGVVEFDYLTVVAMVSVEESKWKNAL